MQSKITPQYQKFENTWWGWLWRKAVSCTAGRHIRWCNPVTDLGRNRRPIITPLGIYTENKPPQINSTCTTSFIATLWQQKTGDNPDVCQQRPDCTTGTPTQWNTVQCFEQAAIVSMYSCMWGEKARCGTIHKGRNGKYILAYFAKRTIRRLNRH